MDQRVPLPDATIARERLRWRLGFAGMMFTMLVFGANFVVSRHAILNGLTAQDLMALRFGTSGLILLPTFIAGGIATCGGVGWWRGIVLAILSGFPMSYLMFSGLTLAPAAHGATIAPGLVTVIGIVGGVILFATPLTKRLIVGVAAVLAGLAGLAVAGTTHTSPTILMGDLCFIGVGLIWGCYPLLVQLWRIEPLKATTAVCVLSLAYIPIYAMFSFRGFDVAPWWVIVLHGINQGVLNVIIGLSLWAVAVRVLGAGVAGRFPPLIPVIGTLLSIPVLGEIPSGLQITGISLIIGGLFIASWKRTPPPAAEPDQAQIPADGDSKPENERRG